MEAMPSFEAPPVFLEHYECPYPGISTPHFHEGRYRFPTLRKGRLATATHDVPALAVHQPPSFQPSTFVQHWRSSPIYFDDQHIGHISPEGMHQGILFVIDLKDDAWPYAIPIQHGSRVKIRAHHNDSIRYMVTWLLPSNETGAIYVQVNAFVEDGCPLVFYDPDWPTLRIRIPIRLGHIVEVPYPPVIVQDNAQHQSSLERRTAIAPTPNNSPSAWAQLVNGLCSCLHFRNPACP